METDLRLIPGNFFLLQKFSRLLCQASRRPLRHSRGTNSRRPGYFRFLLQGSRRRATECVVGFANSLFRAISNRGVSLNRTLSSDRACFPRCSSISRVSSGNFRRLLVALIGSHVYAGSCSRICIIKSVSSKAFDNPIFLCLSPRVLPE